MMKPIFFKTGAEFRKWLSKNHKKETELLVGFYKVGSGKPSMTWSESVDEALCFGWIDGVRKSVDDERYTIRFTPRKPTSIWSAVNIKKMEELIRKGLVQPEGLAAYEKRKESRSQIYTYEKAPVKLDRNYERKFKANKNAWAFFQSQAPSYQRVIIGWIMSAKQEATQVSRLEKAIGSSHEGKRL
jgi:uncharacterized protein YdeI (YjbR/CyaY-like superfamily)